MKKEELHIWANKFKNIVYLKGLVTTRNNDIKALSRYDNNDSHKQAICNAIKYRDEANKAFNDSCEGFEYAHIMASIRQGKYLLSKTQLKNTTETWIQKFEDFDPFNQSFKIIKNANNN